MKWPPIYIGGLLRHEWAPEPPAACLRPENRPSTAISGSIGVDYGMLIPINVATPRYRRKESPMSNTQREIILSGIRPTGRLHYGNYFGAIRHFLRLQEQDTATCYYFVADYHALTTITEPTRPY